jgi:translocator protein
MVALCGAVAALGGLSTASAIRDWYPGLDKPPWTPPNAWFGPIWTALYAGIAVAGWDLVRKGGRRAGLALGLFALQLGLNAAWSPVFFGAQQTWLGLGVISAMWVAILACAVASWRHSRLAAALMVPYLGWVSIAWTLNAWIAWFNP